MDHHHVFYHYVNSRILWRTSRPALTAVPMIIHACASPIFFSWMDLVGWPMIICASHWRQKDIRVSNWIQLFRVVAVDLLLLNAWWEFGRSFSDLDACVQVSWGRWWVHQKCAWIPRLFLWLNLNNIRYFGFAISKEGHGHCDMMMHSVGMPMGRRRKWSLHYTTKGSNVHQMRHPQVHLGA